MRDYLEDLARKNSCTSDIEFWECMVDVVGTVDMFVPWAIEATASDLRITDMVTLERRGAVDIVQASLVTDLVWRSLSDPNNHCKTNCSQNCTSSVQT